MIDQLLRRVWKLLGLLLIASLILVTLTDQILTRRTPDRVVVILALTLIAYATWIVAKALRKIRPRRDRQTPRNPEPIRMSHWLSPHSLRRRRRP